MGKKTKFIGLLWCVAAVTLLMHFGVKFDFSLNAADVVTNADESARQQVEQFHQYTDNNINQQQVFQGKDDHDAKSATPNADTDPADVAGNNVDTLEEKQPMPESLPNQPIPGRAPHQPFEPDMDELRIKPPEEHEFSGKNGVLDVKALLKAQQRQEKYEDEELERRLRTRGVNLDSVSDRNQDIKGDNDEGSPDEKVPETIESNEDRVSDNNRNSHNAGDRNFATENVGVRGHRLLYFGDEDNVERPNQAIFHQIYTNNVWEPDHADGGTGSKGGGGSGEGSDPDLIVNLPEILDTVVLDYNVTRLLDAPCGRMKWTSIWLREQATARAAEGLSALAYKGVDVVSSVVIMNRVEFAAETTWSFEVRDLETEAIPNGYDLILCRDALQHLPIVSALKILQNFANSDAKWLLTTSYGDTFTRNYDVPAGWIYNINLKEEPFNLREMEMEFDEGKWGKLLYLYRIDYLKSINFDAIIDGLDLSGPEWQNPGLPR